MGSTGEPDRKRRHFSSISPTAATTKKQPFFPFTEDKKLDTAVLRYQNQKVIQQLEAQKAVYFALDKKFYQLKEKQQAHDDTLIEVNKSWEQLVENLESCSIRTRDSAKGGRNAEHRHPSILGDDASPPPEEDFLGRLLQTGATESCSASNSPNQIEDDREPNCAKTKNILGNIVAAIDDLWHLEDGVCTPIFAIVPENDKGRRQACDNLRTEIKDLRVVLGHLHLKHKSLSIELQNSRDTHAKDIAEIKRLTGELESTIAELEESNSNLAILKAQKDAAQGAFLPVLNLGNKHVTGERARDKQKDLQDMESAVKELLDQASVRLIDLKNLHEQRLGILMQLSKFQSTLKDVKQISTSKAFLLVSDQLEKSKAEVAHYQALFEKLQVEKDNYAWREKELNMKIDFADIFQRASTVADSRIADLENEIQKRIDEKNLIEIKLEEASREPGRKEIIAEFKALLTSLPKDMGIMQSQLSKYKEAALEVHSLRAEVQSLSNFLDRKANELETLSGRSNDQIAEIKRLQAVVQDLKESEQELKLILEMYRRESTDSRDILEARDLEYKAWAHVQNLKSSLDEHSLELRVKAANEAEAIAQQRLAAAEANIADLRQKLETSERDICRLSEVLKSKHEEGEAYLSEIESIGQAYEDMQTQNQHLLQQITERDDYNIKLVLEGVKSRQLNDALLMENRTMEKEMQQASMSLDFYDLKAARIEDQLRMCSEQVEKLAEDRCHSTAALENMQRRLLDVKRESHRVGELLEESRSKVDKSRVDLVELQIELEKERFNKKRIEEELDVARRRLKRLNAHTEGSSIMEKLQQELREYKEILKCTICHERPKEVVITKCYHLFCNTCIHRILETRHRKCPVCAASFGPNDVKAVYI